MKKKKLIIILLLSLLVIILLILFQIIPLPPFLNKNKDSLTSIEKNVKVLTETKKTKIFLLGDDIQFDNKLFVDKIDTLSNSTLDKKDFPYSAIIINDLNDTIKLSEEDIDLLESYIEKDGYIVIYLGEKYSKAWLNENQGYAEVDGNLSYTYYTINGTKTRSIGAWRKEDNIENEKYPNLLGDTLIYEIISYLENI